MSRNVRAKDGAWRIMRVLRYAYQGTGAWHIAGAWRIADMPDFAIERLYSIVPYSTKILQPANFAAVLDSASQSTTSVMLLEFGNPSAGG